MKILVPNLNKRLFIRIKCIHSSFLPSLRWFFYFMQRLEYEIFCKTVNLCNVLLYESNKLVFFTISKTICGFSHSEIKHQFRVIYSKSENETFKFYHHSTDCSLKCLVRRLLLISRQICLLVLTSDEIFQQA